MGLGDGAVNIQTTIILSDVEWEILKSIEGSSFSVVFDGNPGGKGIVVQGVILGECVNINLGFENS